MHSYEAFLETELIQFLIYVLESLKIYLQFGNTQAKQKCSVVSNVVHYRH